MPVADPGPAPEPVRWERGWFWFYRVQSGKCVAYAMLEDLTELHHTSPSPTWEAAEKKIRRWLRRYSDFVAATEE